MVKNIAIIWHNQLKQKDRLHGIGPRQIKG